MISVARLYQLITEYRLQRQGLPLRSTTSLHRYAFPVKGDVLACPTEMVADFMRQFMPIKLESTLCPDFQHAAIPFFMSHIEYLVVCVKFSPEHLLCKLPSLPKIDHTLFRNRNRLYPLFFCLAEIDLETADAVRSYICLLYTSDAADE